MPDHRKRPQPYTLNHWVVGSIPTRCKCPIRNMLQDNNTPKQGVHILQSSDYNHWVDAQWGARAGGGKNCFSKTDIRFWRDVVLSVCCRSPFTIYRVRLTEEFAHTVSRQVSLLSLQAPKFKPARRRSGKTRGRAALNDLAVRLAPLEFRYPVPSKCSDPFSNLRS